MISAVAPAGDGSPTGQPPGHGRVPLVGQLVQVRSRHWLVEEVTTPLTPGGSPRVSLACADDDNQGQSLTVLWDYELDRHILDEEAWADLGAHGFDPPREFSAYLTRPQRAHLCVPLTHLRLQLDPRTLHHRGHFAYRDDSGARRRRRQQQK